MKIETKEDIANFIESHLAELGGDAYGVNYIAEKLMEWHEGELKNLRLGVVVGQSEQLVCEICELHKVKEKGDWCDRCLEDATWSTN